MRPAGVLRPVITGAGCRLRLWPPSTPTPRPALPAAMGSLMLMPARRMPLMTPASPYGASPSLLFRAAQWRLNPNGAAQPYGAAQPTSLRNRCLKTIRPMSSDTGRPVASNQAKLYVCRQAPAGGRRQKKTKKRPWPCSPTALGALVELP